MARDGNDIEAFASDSKSSGLDILIESVRRPCSLGVNAGNNGKLATGMLPVCPNSAVRFQPPIGSSKAG